MIRPGQTVDRYAKRTLGKFNSRPERETRMIVKDDRM